MATECTSRRKQQDVIEAVQPDRCRLLVLQGKTPRAWNCWCPVTTRHWRVTLRSSW